MGRAAATAALTSASAATAATAAATITAGTETATAAEAACCDLFPTEICVFLICAAHLSNLFWNQGALAGVSDGCIFTPSSYQSAQRSMMTDKGSIPAAFPYSKFN